MGSAGAFLLVFIIPGWQRMRMFPVRASTMFARKAIENTEITELFSRNPSEGSVLSVADNYVARSENVFGII